jgi:hypothetical protein
MLSILKIQTSSFALGKSSRINRIWFLLRFTIGDLNKQDSINEENFINNSTRNGLRNN